MNISAICVIAPSHIQCHNFPSCHLALLLSIEAILVHNTMTLLLGVMIGIYQQFGSC
jgi:S-adenosylmethionine/arginine decarboxylase-like enzyme